MELSSLPFINLTAAVILGRDLCCQVSVVNIIQVDLISNTETHAPSVCAVAPHFLQLMYSKVLWLLGGKAFDCAVRLSGDVDFQLFVLVLGPRSCLSWFSSLLILSFSDTACNCFQQKKP